jgi:hypothetical protein
VQNAPRSWKSFWVHPMELLVDVSEMEGHFGVFGNSVNLNA